MERPFVKINLKVISDVDKGNNFVELNALLDSTNDESCRSPNVHECPLVCVEPYNTKGSRMNGSAEESKRNSVTAVITFLFQSPKCASSMILRNSHPKHSSRILIGSTITRVPKRERKLLLELPTKSSSGNNLTVERDLDTSISPSAAEELLVTDVWYVCKEFTGNCCVIILDFYRSILFLYFCPRCAYVILFCFVIPLWIFVGGVVDLLKVKKFERRRYWSCGEIGWNCRASNNELEIYL